MNETVPMRKGTVMTKRITLAVDPEIKRALEELRAQGVDTAEWIRQMIRDGLPKLRQRVA
jgi:hypothetical protein